MHAHTFLSALRYWCGGSVGLAQPIDAPALARIIGAVRERVEADGCDGLLRSLLPESAPPTGHEVVLQGGLPCNTVSVGAGCTLLPDRI